MLLGLLLPLDINSGLILQFGKALGGSTNLFDLPIAFSNTDFVYVCGSNYDMTSHLVYNGARTVSSISMYGNQTGNYRNWFMCIGY